MIDVEHIHHGFTKYHLNRNGEEPWPFRPILHHFASPDVGDPHDHPWDFRTFIIQGSYVEDVYTPSGIIERHKRVAGASYKVAAEHIHKIVELPDGDCWTMVFYGPTRRESLFYRFGETIQTRPWHQSEFR